MPKLSLLKQELSSPIPATMCPLRIAIDHLVVETLENGHRMPPLLAVNAH